MQLNQIPKMISYKEKVYNQLKQAIIKNELKPGEVLNERFLADKLGISRTPIREALHYLESEGWVETEPCRGTWVRRITINDIEELYQMRRGLESLAVELAIQSMDEDGIQDLEKMVQKLSVLDLNLDHKIFVDMDTEFHLYLAKISRNGLLYQSMNGLMDMMAMYVIQNMIRKTDPYSIPIKEHIEILNMMLNKDVDAAKLAVVKHINRAYSAATENIRMT